MQGMLSSTDICSQTVYDFKFPLYRQWILTKKHRKENNMKIRKLGNIVMSLMMTVLLSLAGGAAFAADPTPMTPELAAKREMVRNQQEQRITPEKRKAAVEALKAERLKIYKARESRKLMKLDRPMNKQSQPLPAANSPQ
jgi:hypothetical protein